jgi:hypothetical protein
VAQLPQIAALLHDRGELVGRGVGRTVIDVDDFVDPTAIKCGCDFGNQRRHVLGFVAHGHNDGNGHGSGIGRRQNRHSVGVGLSFDWT